MKVVSFHSKTTPWRVQLPARFSNDGKRKSKYFRTKQEAEQFCKKVNQYGIAALQDFVPAVSKTQTDQMQTAIRWALAELSGDFSLVYDAINHYKLTRLNIRQANVREAFEAFQLSRQNDGLASRTIQSDAARLRKLMIRYSDTPIAQLSKVQLLEFFDGISKGSVRSIYKSVRKFFCWAHERNYLGENPMATIRPIGDWGINNEFYPVETFARMLRVAAGLEAPRKGEEQTREFIALLPYFVLGGFAGLRPCELFRTREKPESIRWTDLYFAGVDHPHIEIRHEVAKRTKRKTGLRHIDMQAALDAVNAWLGLCDRNEPFIIKFGSRKMQDLKTAFTERTGIKFLENGFRNSFATYALSYSTLSGLGHVAKQMGNSEAICAEHYSRNLPTGSGKAWFDLRPFEVIRVKAQVAG